MRNRGWIPGAWSRRRRLVWLSLTVLLLLFVAATIRLFVLPARDAPRHADAIIVLGGDGNRVGKGLALARAGYASTLLLSRVGSKPCYWTLPHVDVECFRPEPFTTQGEARYIASVVRQHKWKSVIVVISTDQTTRARLRIERCTDVDVAYVTTGLPALRWPRQIAYQWAALAKALVFQRGC